MLRPLRRAQENQPEKRCQEGPEKVPNRDGSRGGENPGSGGRPNVVPFQLTRYFKNSDSEAPASPAPIWGVFRRSQNRSSGGPPGQSSETIKATRSKSTRSSHLRSLLSSSVLVSLLRLRVVVLVRCCCCIGRSDQIFVRVQRSD